MTGQANDGSLFFNTFSQHLLNGNPFQLVFGGKSPIFFERKTIEYLESALIGGTIHTSDSQICSLPCRKSAAEVNAERQITFSRRHLRLRRQYDSEEYYSHTMKLSNAYIFLNVSLAYQHALDPQLPVFASNLHFPRTVFAVR